jgi:hypothetical protein
MANVLDSTQDTMTGRHQALERIVASLSTDAIDEDGIRALEQRINVVKEHLERR